MRKSYLDYAMSVIVSRALPDVRDGLKPVHRRILFAMHGMGIRWNSSYKKSARIVGEVLGKYHPHGDSAVYDALVRLAQDFSMRYPLVDGQGNFGSIDGDSPAAMRYTEARMARISEELLADIDKETVEFADNFDGSQQEPVVMPARMPNLLLMGAEGIAVGMATKIPPHNLREIAAAIDTVITKGHSKRVPAEALEGQDAADIPAETLSGHFDSEATLEDILDHVNGPDFPTGGYIYDWDAIKNAYATGRGRITMRAKAEIVEHGRGHQIVITEIPYQVNKAKLIVKIADLVKNKKVEGISDIRDESDRQGLTIAIDLKRGSRPKSVLNNLFKYTDLQSNFSMNMVALNSDGTPQLMTIRHVMMEFIRHRQLVTVRRLQYELRGLRDRAHILEGLLKALDILDEVIATIRSSADTETAKNSLMEKYGFTEVQAVAILDMQLRKLAALERQKLQDEYTQIKARIEEIEDILMHPQKILDIIRQETKELADTYGDDRKTVLVKGKVGEINEEDLVPDESTIVVYTEGGYIKRLSADTYRTQRRGGKGVMGMKTKEEDPIKEIISARTHDTLLMFTNTGRVYSSRVFDIPEGSRQSKGTALVNVINLDSDETIQNMLILPKDAKDQTGFVLFATRGGKVKKTPLSEYENIRSTGIIAITLKDDDEVVYTRFTDGDCHVMLVTHEGKCIRFHEDEVKESSRDTQGVMGIKLKKSDFVVGGQAFPANPTPPEDKRRRFFFQLMVITERGMGKRTELDEYPVQKRGGQGVKVSSISSKTGKVAAALIVTHEHEDIIMSTHEAQVIKLPLKNIPVLKRPTQGVILMRMPKSDSIVTATATKHDLDEEEE
ncbi:DNA gyrase subunit A [Candidatus Woesebacteria bacterium]|nr:DNA gyrase subunit A [Candidatus Woesebacteria bacterium]